MVELEREKLQQNSRMEQLMTTLLGQMGGAQPTQVQPANAEVTPEKNRPAVVVPEMPGAGPGTGGKLTRPGILAQQQAVEWMPARHPGEQQHSGDASGSQEVAEERRRVSAMEDALKDVLTMGEGAGMMARLLEAKGHGGVVGMIALGGQLPPKAE